MSLLARAGSFSFAHLMGLGAKPVAKKRAEDDDEKERDENEAKKSAEDEKPEHYEDDGKGKKAETDEERAEREEDENEASKRAEKDDEEEDDDEEMKKAKAAGFGKALSAARRAERSRIGRILSSASAEGRVATAAHLACNTDLSSREAIGLLRTVPKAEKPRSALADAMARTTKPGTAVDDGTKPSPVSALGAAMQREIDRHKARRAA